MNADATKPALSIVVVLFAGGEAIVRLLEALREQQGLSAPVEVIIAAAHGTVDARAVHAIAPQARLLRGPPGTHPAQLRALGVAVASAPIVACTEDHCVPASDWCVRILAAHQGPALAVGGAIRKLQPDAAIAWAAYLLEYARFMPPLQSGPAHYVSDCNVSYKRSMLTEIAATWHAAFHETSVHDALRQRGGATSIVLDPTIVVFESRRPDAGTFLAERFDHGRLFARLRAATYGPAGRLLYAAAALGLSPLLVLRAFTRAWRQPDARVGALRALPYLVAGSTCWSIGESVGAITAARSQ
ncbi:MAG: glycosyltransferase [Gemmatimonadaceae bacterium]